MCGSAKFLGTRPSGSQEIANLKKADKPTLNNLIISPDAVRGRASCCVWEVVTPYEELFCEFVSLTLFLKFCRIFHHFFPALITGVLSNVFDS